MSTRTGRMSRRTLDSQKAAIFWSVLIDHRGLAYTELSLEFSDRLDHRLGGLGSKRAWLELDEAGSFDATEYT